MPGNADRVHEGETRQIKEGPHRLPHCSVGKVDGPENRGRCGYCKELVYINEPRECRNGIYFHDECILEMNTAINNTRKQVEGDARSITASLKRNIICCQSKQDTSEDSKAATNRGDCGICGKGVFTDQVRTFENGKYYHQVCRSSGEDGGRSANFNRSPADSSKHSTASMTVSTLVIAKTPDRTGGSESKQGRQNQEAKESTKYTTSRTSTGSVDRTERNENKQEQQHPEAKESMKYTPNRTSTTGFVKRPGRTGNDSKQERPNWEAKENTRHTTSRTPSAGSDDVGVYKDHLRNFENGMYFHDGCSVSGILSTALKPALKPTLLSSMNLDSLEFTPTTVRMYEDSQPYAVRFSDDTTSRGQCGLCDDEVFNNQLRTYENGMYFHDECLNTSFSQLPTGTAVSVGVLSASTDSPSDKYESRVQIHDAQEPISEAVVAYDRGLATDMQELQDACGLLSPKAHAEIPETRTDSPSRRLVDCCSILQASTPRLEQLFPCRDSAETMGKRTSDEYEHIIPEQFLQELRKCGNVQICSSEISVGASARECSNSGIPSERSKDANADPKDRLVGQFWSETNKPTTRNPLQAKVTKSQQDFDNMSALDAVQMVLNQVHEVENSMSDDELASVLENMGKMTKMLSADRQNLVSSLRSSRQECEHLKDLALLACKESLAVVERAKAQSKSRLEAKKKLKAENEVLKQKSLVLTNACIKMSEEHAMEVEKMMDMNIQERAQMKTHLQMKMDKIAGMLMRITILEVPFREWVRLVYKTNLENKISLESKRIVQECATRCIEIQDEEGEKMRCELMQECSRQIEELKQEHEKELANLRTVYEEEKSMLKDEHGQEILKYQQHLEALRVILFKKMDIIAGRLMRNIIAEGPFQAWAIATKHSKFCGSVQARIDVRSVFWALSKAFGAWEIARGLSLSLEGTVRGNKREVEASRPDIGSPSDLSYARRCATEQILSELSALETPAAHGLEDKQNPLTSSQNHVLLAHPPRTSNKNVTSPVYRLLDVTRERCDFQKAKSSLFEADGKLPRAEVQPRTPPRLRESDGSHERPVSFKRSQSNSCPDKAVESRFEASSWPGNNSCASSTPSAAPLQTANVLPAASPIASPLSSATKSSLPYSSGSGQDLRSMPGSCSRSDYSGSSAAWLTEKTRVGIGAYFKRSETHPDALEVKSILPRSAAETCNLISPGDHIIAVDGEPVSGKSLAQLATKILGPSNSTVECSFLKPTLQETYSVSLVRGVSS